MSGADGVYPTNFSEQLQIEVNKLVADHYLATGFCLRDADGRRKFPHREDAKAALVAAIQSGDIEAREAAMANYEGAIGMAKRDSIYSTQATRIGLDLHHLHSITSQAMEQVNERHKIFANDLKHEEA